jgi:hypothetical protein
MSAIFGFRTESHAAKLSEIEAMSDVTDDRVTIGPDVAKVRVGDSFNEGSRWPGAPKDTRDSLVEAALRGCSSCFFLPMKDTRDSLVEAALLGCSSCFFLPIHR